MGSSFLSEVGNTSILRTGALHRYHYLLTWLPASRLLLPRSGLERSDFVLWPRPCENARTLNRDRTSYSFKTDLGANIASPIDFEIELENIILVALRVFEFSHSLGPKRRSRNV